MISFAHNITFQTCTSFARFPLEQQMMLYVANIISDEKLEGTFVYIYSLTLFRYDYTGYNLSLKWFIAAVNKYNLLLSKSKCSFFFCNTTNQTWCIVSKTFNPTESSGVKTAAYLDVF